jgi:hypothetical protein
MQIKLEYSDSYVRKVFIETGVALEPKWVEIDATNLTPEDRKRLLAVSTGDYEERELNFWADDQTDDVMKLVNDYWSQYEAERKRQEAEKKQREEQKRQEAEREQMIKERRLAWIGTNGSNFLRELVREGFSCDQRFRMEYEKWYVKDISERTGMEWVYGTGSDCRDCSIGSSDQADEQVLEVYKLVKDIENVEKFSYGCSCKYAQVQVSNEQVGVEFYIHVNLK